MTPRPPYNVYAVNPKKTLQLAINWPLKPIKSSPKRPLNPYFTHLFSHQTHSYGTARVQMTPQATLLCQCCQGFAISTLKTSWTDFLEPQKQLRLSPKRLLDLYLTKLSLKKRYYMVQMTPRPPNHVHAAICRPYELQKHLQQAL